MRSIRARIGIYISLFLSITTSVYPLPQVSDIVSGSADVSVDGSTMIINAADNTVMNFSSFDVLAGESVLIYLPSAGSSMLSNVLGNAMSRILGAMSCNGMFVLVNPAGIYVGPAADIDAGRLIMSTRQIALQDFLTKNFVFEKLSDEQVDRLLKNEGSITISEGGFGVLIAGAIENTGSIIAPAGTVALAAGDAVKLDVAGNGLISVAIQRGTGSSIVDQNGSSVIDQIVSSGSLSANGGAVILSAKSIGDVFENAINLEGVVRANSVQEKDGRVIISADKNVRVNADIKATYVDIDAQNILIDGGTIESEKGTTIHAANDLTVRGHLTVDSGDLRLYKGGMFSQTYGITTIKEAGKIYLNDEVFSMPALPLYFIRNVGQEDNGSLYYVEVNGQTYFFDETSVYFNTLSGNETDGYVWMPIRLRFEDSNRSTLRAEMAAGAVFNYYQGQDAYEDVGSYYSLRYDELYNGIDLVYVSKDGALETEYRVAAGADYNDIRMSYENALGLSIDESGNLKILTANGEMTEYAPYAYQYINGERKEVQAQYVLLDDNTYGFSVGAHDTGHELIIDPTLEYSTYLTGTTAADTASAIVVDAAGAVYVAGRRGDLANLAHYNAFVQKLNPAGNAVDYTTILQGGCNTTDDWASAIALDAAGNAYIAGITDDNNFVITAGAYDTTFNGSIEAFAAKLDLAGGLVYSTYLGGAGIDRAYDVAVDAAGNAYIAGETYSANFPVVPGNAAQASNNGAADAFLAIINAAGSSMLASTYLGGSDGECANALAIDSFGDVYLAGYTASTGATTDDFPRTAGAFQLVGNADHEGFITKIDVDLTGGTTAITASTFFGNVMGGTFISVNDIALDSSNNVYVAGGSSSATMATTAGAFQTVFGGANDGFIGKLNPSLTTSAYETYVGGSNWDDISALALDSAGRAYVTGYTASADLYTSADAFSDTLGGSVDGFMFVLSADGSTAEYSSYLGAAGDAYGNAIALGSDNYMYIAGSAEAGFVTTPGAYDTSNAGDHDPFVFKYKAVEPPPPAPDPALEPDPAPEPPDEPIVDFNEPAVPQIDAPAASPEAMITMEGADESSASGGDDGGGAPVDDGSAAEEPAQDNTQEPAPEAASDVPAVDQPTEEAVGGFLFGAIDTATADIFADVYKPATYKTTVIVTEGAVMVGPYTEQGPDYNQAKSVTSGEMISAVKKAGFGI